MWPGIKSNTINFVSQPSSTSGYEEITRCSILTSLLNQGCQHRHPNLVHHEAPDVDIWTSCSEKIECVITRKISQDSTKAPTNIPLWPNWFHKENSISHLPLGLFCCIRLPGCCVHLVLLLGLYVGYSKSPLDLIYCVHIGPVL